MSNVGGSAGEGGFDFQARLIALTSVYIFTQNVFTGLGRELGDVPTAVSAETNGPGDDIQIEFSDNSKLIEIQAKKGLRVDTRFSDTLEKIASGLAQNASLNVVLAVDPKTTKRVREKLSHDLKRFRQGRVDIPQDQELLNLALNIFKKYATSEEHANELFKRLFVVTFDIETETSNEVLRAIALLQTHVLAEKEQATVAWDILVYEGHQIIKERGRRTSIDLARLLQSRNIQLLSSLPSILIDEYRKWLLTRTATFSILGPTLGKPLPIETAWAELRVVRKRLDQAPQNLEAQNATYHEVGKLATHDESYKALDVAKIEHRVVIIGGPGTGKSTLCRKLAHDLTELEELVLWVRLSEVVNRIDEGMSINEALTDVATNGYPIAKQTRGILFNQVDCLIADGLDECGPHLIQIAEGLQQWATAHPNVRVVITTRPMGYDPRFFSNWEHQELLPLTEDEVGRDAYQIIAAVIEEHDALENEFQRFQTYLQKNRVTSLASHNPLLLGFLVQLSLTGTHPAKSRAGLYEQIIDLWYMVLLRDRDIKITDLDSWAAQRSFEILGWLILQASTQEELSGKKLTQRLAQHFLQECDTKQPSAHRLAEKCLHFWQERGVLELLQFRHENMYTFVHATLGEYGAARYIANLDIPSIQKWVRNKYSDPHWREPLLLAAGIGAVDTVVEVLLDIDLNSNSDMAELLLAAAALAETDSDSRLLATKVIERLKTLLISPTPSIVYKIAKHVAGFAAQASELLYPFLVPLLEHAQVWTRISTMYLMLVGGNDFANLDILVQILDGISMSQREVQEIVDTSSKTDDTVTAATLRERIRERILFSTDDWFIQNKVVVLGAEVLGRLRPNEATKTLLQSLYLSESISANTYFRLSEILTKLGCQEFVEQHSPGVTAIKFLIWRKNSHLADVKMLETILRVTNFAFIPPKKPRKLLALTTLVYALDVPKSGVSAWDILRRLDDTQAIEAVLLGFIQAFSISPKELALDTMWVLNEILKAEQDEAWSISLLYLLPKIPVKLDTFEDTNIDVPIEDLVRALKHPSAIIAKGALYLLLISKPKKELLDLLKNEDEQVLQIIEKIAD